MTVPSINLKMIRLGKTKKIEGKYKYKTTPIIYDEYPFEMVVYGYSKFFSFNQKALSIGLDIDKNNEDFFKSIEEQISDLYGKKLDLIKTKKVLARNGKKLDLIETKRVYAKLDVKNGKVQTPVGRFFDDPKIIKDPFDDVKTPFYARIVMRISRIYEGNCLSLICEANEVIVQ